MRRIDLKETIIEDCKLWEKLKNENAMMDDYLYLNECDGNSDSNLYQLILNGCELWYGTLQEINAVVKSMIALIEKKDEFCLSV